MEKKVYKGRMDDHYCNGVTDPSACCPCHPAHGAMPKEFCTCKVSPDMRDAVHRFEEELYRETWRVKEWRNNKFIWRLTDHRAYEVTLTTGERAWRVDCRLGRGSAPLGCKGLNPDICPCCYKMMTPE